jgi:hypothetical protein
MLQGEAAMRPTGVHASPARSLGVLVSRCAGRMVGQAVRLCVMFLFWFFHFFSSVENRRGARGVVVLEGHVSDGGLGGSGGNNPPEDPQHCPIQKYDAQHSLVKLVLRLFFIQCLITNRYMIVR